MNPNTNNTNNDEDILNSSTIYENMTEEQKSSYDRILYKLPELQDKLNRDKSTYQEEFDKILITFREQFNIILFHPSKTIKGFRELLLFFSHQSSAFPNELSFIPQGLVQILQENYLIIPHETRLAMIDSLSLLRKKDMWTPMEVLPIFFSLIKCQDKILRKKLCDCILTDWQRINWTHKNNIVNRKLQNFCEGLLNDPNKKQSRKTLNLMITLYQKRIWNDSRTINAIGNCVGTNDIKMSSAACQFFLSEYEINKADTSSEEELDDLKNKYKLLGKANTKKTKTRKNKLKIWMKSIERHEKRRSKVVVNKDFMPIDQINDPMTFADKWFHKVNANMSANFTNKLILVRWLGRVLGRHRWIWNNYFNFILNFMKNNQKDVNIIMASMIEACHDQVPPSELEPVITKLFDNFISETFSPPLITLGLNTLREIIERCPYCINKGEYSVVENLRQYKHKSVSNAARSIINLCKEIDGKYGKGNGEISFGASKINDGIDGIELWKKLEKKPKEYQMEYEEILDDKQLKKWKAWKLKYNAEFLQRKRVGITNKDINEMVGDNGKYEEDEGEDGDDEEMELEEISDEGVEFEDDEDEDLDKVHEHSDLEIDENKSEGEDEEEEEEEEIELDSDEINSDDSVENSGEEKGFIDADKLKEVKWTRAQKRDQIQNEEKEKFKVNRKKKSGGLSNKEKLKFKPMMMVRNKKRLQSKINNSNKLQSLNKKIKKSKQQLGRFKRGNMVLKKKKGMGSKKK